MASLVALGIKFSFKSKMKADLGATYNIVASSEVTIDTKKMFAIYKNHLAQRGNIEKYTDLPTGKTLGQFTVASCQLVPGSRGEGDMVYKWIVVRISNNAKL